LDEKSELNANIGSMKQLVCLLLLIFLFACDSSESATDQTIKQVLVYESEFDSGKEINRKLVEKRIYDEKEALISEIHYEENGDVDYQRTYEYDSKGREITSTEKRKRLPYFICKRTYDNRDSIAQLTIFDGNNKRDFTIQVKYDQAGRNYKDVAVNADGSVKFWDEYEHNRHGKVTKWTRYNPDSTPQSKVIYEYDKQGREIKNRCSGDLGGTYGSKYNEKGLKIEETAYNTVDNLFLWLKVYSYDESGRITKVVEYNDLKHRPKNPHRISNYEYTFW
jgi:uncharacterized protein YcfL